MEGQQLGNSPGWDTFTLGGEWLSFEPNPAFIYEESEEEPELFCECCGQEL